MAGGGEIMKTLKKYSTLEDVINAYVATETSPTHSALKKWISEYPEYEKELIDFSVSWSLMNEMPPTSNAETVDETTLILRGMSIVENRLHAMRNQTNKRKVDSLLKEGKRLGLSINDIAADCELSPAIVKKLEQRLIDYKSIPSLVIERLASEIQTTFPAVFAYLRQPMSLSRNARYRSRAAPKLESKRQDFFDAVKTDRTLDEKRRAFWFSFDSSNSK
jgi:hypothetical protein